VQEAEEEFEHGRVIDLKLARLRRNPLTDRWLLAWSSGGGFLLAEKTLSDPSGSLSNAAVDDS